MSGLQKEESGYTVGNIIIEQSVINAFLDFQRQYSFDKESGGIIIGYYDSSILKIRITDITFPQSNDQQSRFRFVRSSAGHQEIMDKLWESSGYMKSYLGEWHSHNQRDPSPSWIDLRNWKKITRRNNNYETSIFIIIGTRSVGIWESCEQINKLESLHMDDLK